MNSKYTKEILEKAVNENKTISGVLKSLGLSVKSGGSHSHISKRIKYFGINTSHFVGMKSSIVKKCKTCNVQLCKSNKSGHCHKCRYKPAW